MIDYNKKYKFISDGTWFIKGSECIVEDGHILWDTMNPDNEEEMSYDFLVKNKNNISGLFRGPIKGNDDDGELCQLCEFEIVLRSKNR